MHDALSERYCTVQVFQLVMILLWRFGDTFIVWLVTLWFSDNSTRRGTDREEFQKFHDLMFGKVVESSSNYKSYTAE